MANDEINFDSVSNVTDGDSGLNSDSFLGPGNFLKNPVVGSELILNVVKVERSDKTTAKTKTGTEFAVGLKQKDGQVKRFDIVCTDGIYTVSNWEIYFKLFGSGANQGLLMKYANKHNKSFAGAKISIKRLIDGAHAGLRVEDLSKIIGKSVQEAQKYQDEIKLAIKEQRLFEIKEVI
jgi:hypothetical protein